MKPDLLEILEYAANEIRTLRKRAETDRAIRDSQVIRIAISQMRGNRIVYQNAPKYEWDLLLKLMDAGRICMDNTGEIMLDNLVLTSERLRSETETNQKFLS